MQSGPWSWLEVAKLCVECLTPILLVLLGVSIQRTIKQFEHQQWRSQKLIEKRIEVYDELAPLFNHLLCYYTFVGSWRDTSPLEIIKTKREIDARVYLAKPLFTPQFFEASMNFISLCFETYTGIGKDARLKTDFKQRQIALGAEWDPDWEKCFSNVNTGSHAIREGYERLMAVFSTDLGVCDSKNFETQSNARIIDSRRIGIMWSILRECAS